MKLAALVTRLHALLHDPRTALAMVAAIAPACSAPQPFAGSGPPPPAVPPTKIEVISNTVGDVDVEVTLEATLGAEAGEFELGAGDTISHLTVHYRNQLGLASVFDWPLDASHILDLNDPNLNVRITRVKFRLPDKYAKTNAMAVESSVQWNPYTVPIKGDLEYICTYGSDPLPIAGFIQ